MTRVLVTGATGLVGRTLCTLLSSRGHTVRAALRSRASSPAGAHDCVYLGEIDARTDWRGALGDVECVVHCAARVHVMGAASRDDTPFIETNVHGTARLAQACAEHGIGRLIYLSTIKVNGEITTSAAFSRNDTPRPCGAYATSKWLAENRCAEIAARSAVQLSVVRAPLIYGPGVRANFLRLMRLVDARMPLPLGCIRNRRSLISVWNLCDLIARLIDVGPPGHRVFLASDGEDVSTPDLVRRLGAALQRPVRLLPVPVPLLRAAARLLRAGSEVTRLSESLTVDIGPTCTELRWTPPLPLNEGLVRTAQWFRSQVAHEH